MKEYEDRLERLELLEGIVRGLQATESGHTLFFGRIRRFRIYWKSLNIFKQTTQPRPKNSSRKLKRRFNDLACRTPAVSCRNILSLVSEK
jgi:hypothetical protein